MSLMLSLSAWDWALVIIVAFQATCLAYFHHPFWKAFVLSLPLPFTLAMLSLGRPLDVTNIAGLGLLLIFFHGVRIAYRRWKCPIVVAIVLAVAVHVGLSATLAAILSHNEALFWAVTVLVLAAALVLHAFYSHPEEPGYRTPLPVWIKFPAIAGVILGIVLIKGWILGFMTAFPMVGTIAAYEGRFLLGTLCRQMPILVLTMLPVMIVIRLVQPTLGYRWALVPAWLVFLCILIPVMRHQWLVYHRRLE